MLFLVLMVSEDKGDEEGYDVILTNMFRFGRFVQIIIAVDIACEL